MKPGYQTTEFYLSTLAVIVGALVTAGVFVEGSVGARIAGAVVAALGAMGYSASRGAVKAAHARKGGDP